MDKLES